MIQIRKAIEIDLPAILEIVNEAIANTTAIYDYEPRTFAQQSEWFAEKMASGFPVFVAENEEEVIGFGTYGTFRVKAAYQFTVEHSVYVVPTAWKLGAGKLLLQQLIDQAKADGYHTMVGCIDAENSGSITFHGKFGFAESGTLKQVGFKFGRWLDLCLMQLLLK